MTIAIDSTGTLLAQVKYNSIELTSIYNPSNLIRYSYIEEAHEASINSLYFLPEGKGLLSGDKEGLIKLWNLQGNIRNIYLGHTSCINDVVSLGDFLISSSSDNTINIWGLSDGTLLNTLDNPNEAYCLAINKEYLISGSSFISIWNLITGDVSFTLNGHSSKINRLVIKGKYLASASSDYTVKVWDLEEKVLVNSYGPLLDMPRELIFHPESYALFIGYDGNSNIILWDPFDDKVNLVLQGHSTPISSFVIRDIYNSDTEQLISVSMDGKVKVWSIYTGLLINDDYFKGNLSKAD